MRSDWQPVVLPTGWRERLHTLEDENGNVVADVVDIHDVAVSKLIAGREKDYVFLKELIMREYISIGVFLERAKLIKETLQSEVLTPRLKHLAEILPKKESSAVKQLLTELKSD